MTKRTVQTLGMMLLATPLFLVGCGSGESGGGTGGAGGTGGTTYDGAPGTGGARLDAEAAPDLKPAPVDVGVDTSLPDVPMVPDAH